MFSKGLRLFSVLGFEVRIDASWLMLAVLIILSLTTGYFPVHVKDLAPGDYWLMGVLGAFGLFASIVFHELCHSLVARKYGIPMKGITLFMFGGVAQMEEEATSPKAEFWMAIAGPIASVALALGFHGVSGMGAQLGWARPVVGIFAYLAWINMVLALFNLLPAFPLDGGRVLRSALWAWRENLRWATRIASEIGSGFGVALVVLGIFNLLGGDFIGGLWWCLIGMFLRGVSHASYRQLVIRGALAGERVTRFMKEGPISVSPDLTVEALVNDYVYQHHFKMFPVVESDGRLLGCVTTREIKAVPRSEWSTRSVRAITAECSDVNTISAQADATDALAMMSKSGNSRLTVVEDGRLCGVIALKDMLGFLTLKLDLEGEETDALKLQEHLGVS